MSFGFGPLPGASAGLSPEDIARLFSRIPMGAGQGFSGYSTGAVPSADQIQAPAAPLQAPVASPLGFGALPGKVGGARAPVVAAPEPAAAGGPVLPDFQPAPLPADTPTPPARPLSFGSLTPPTPAADMPAADAVPASGTVPTAATKASDGLGFMEKWKAVADSGLGDQLLALSSGLLSARGGAGWAKGFENMQRAGAASTATGLANTEMLLKQQKLAREMRGENATRDYLRSKGMDASLSEAAMSNPTVLSATLAQLNKDPSRVTIGGNIYELKPGEKPAASNMLGPAEVSPEIVRAKAQAQAEGTAAGKPDETYTQIPEAERVSLGLPAGAYQRDSKGKLSAVNPAGTTINMGAEKAQDSTVGKGYGEYQLDLANKGRNAGSTLNTLSLMEQAARDPNFYSGVGAEGLKTANQLMVALGVKDASFTKPTEVFEALSNKVVLDSLGGSLGPGISNTDRDYLGRVAPGLSRTKEGNLELIGIARALAQRQQDVAKLAREYAAKNNGRIDSGFDDVLTDYSNKNALFPAASAASTARPVGQTGATGAGGLAAPTTQAEFDALPRGSVYVDPADGKKYRK
ncbi:hypothetical protein [Methylobacterium sp. Leaf85]|uniref:hypothetical protein n=1 Tax=Methylobacterium sp. Leaf85 TaxID=1736241 RepID=UPI0006F6647E|nr:hypothetical protein [Methylobacterium sp. Leaf85]KQO43031.1 hypothetical protein ASF08_10670 [Methylobacterium sp. Leaf85]